MPKHLVAATTAAPPKGLLRLERFVCQFRFIDLPLDLFRLREDLQTYQQSFIRQAAIAVSGSYTH
jgi:hypothetical protein